MVPSDLRIHLSVGLRRALGAERAQPGPPRVMLHRRSREQHEDEVVRVGRRVGARPLAPVVEGRRQRRLDAPRRRAPRGGGPRAAGLARLVLVRVTGRVAPARHRAAPLAHGEAEGAGVVGRRCVLDDGRGQVDDADAVGLAADREARRGGVECAVGRRAVPLEQARRQRDHVEPAEAGGVAGGVTCLQPERVRGRAQTIIRQSSGSRQAIVGQPSGNHQAIIKQTSSNRRTIIRQSSGSHQAVVRQSWCNHERAACSQSGCKAALRPSSDSHQANIRSSWCSHERATCSRSESQPVWRAPLAEPLPVGTTTSSGCACSDTCGGGAGCGCAGGAGGDGGDGGEGCSSSAAAGGGTSPCRS
eukprot:6116958-Prymnesium_polylepis.1